jgi:hypothetical protein
LPPTIGSSKVDFNYRGPGINQRLRRVLCCRHMARWRMYDRFVGATSSAVAAIKKFGSSNAIIILMTLACMPWQ